ncbi:MAG: redoxin family protein [Phycisphaeraceae bacterium]|nr:redoxin family protein [Phycisphaeraceae bacterium]
MRLLSKPSVLLLAVGTIAACLALPPMAMSTALAGEKAGAGSGSPQSRKLEVGSNAPEFYPSKWIKGDPVKKFDQGKVYVVEFWATWCGPCLQSIPHLTEMQKKYKDSVVIIGMASSERVSKGGKDERFARVQKFVKDQGDNMNYRVAFEADRKVSKAWMGAAGVSTIPHAFIVGGDGKIVWIGDPRVPAFGENLKSAVEAANADMKKDN